mgnify:CR=1 FL=1
MPSMPAKTAVPGWPRSRSERKSSEGLAISRRPGAGHLEDADFICRTEAVFHRAQDTELVRAFAFEGQHRIDHMFDDTGPAIWPVLGDVADQDDRPRRTFGEPDERLRPIRAPASPCRARTQPCAVHMVWIESDDDQARSLAFRKGCDDVFNRGFSRKLDRTCRASLAARRAGEPAPLLLHLKCKPRGGQRGRGRQRPDQQGRFADSRIPANQQHRAAHEAPTGDAVEFRHHREGRRGAS